MKKKLLRLFSIILLLLICGSSQAQFSYTFSAVGGAWTANAAPTTIHAAGVDDALSAALPIGFTFNYNCVNYTQVKVSSNGWLTFNTAIVGSNATNDLDLSSDRPIIAPLWDDLQVGAGSTVNYQLTGSSPNRVFTVEWSQMEWRYTATAWAIGCQVKLYETSNVIEFIYIRNGNATFNTATPTASIGLSGGAGEFYSLADVTAAPVVSTVTETDVLASKPLTGQIYRWTPSPACSGTPAAGTATPAPASVCNGSTSTISLIGYSSGCGISFQWQSAAALAGPYSNIAGATSTSYVATITSVTYFRCITTCSNGGGTATSSVATVTLNLPTSCYCTSTATSTADMDITNISLGTINNTSATVSLTGSQGTATGTAGMYSDWRASAVPVPSLMQGSSPPFSVQIGGTAYSHRVDVYVDFNQDGDFIDAGENIAIFPYANPALPNTTVSNIAIPLTATLGNTVLRVVCVESSTTNPCGTYTWGETEDYNINIIAATPMAYSSCTATQANTSNVAVGSTAQEIIGIQIVTTGVTSPLSVTQFTLNATGSTAIADINGATAKIYYTGNSSTFATTTFFGGTIPTIANYPINGSQALANGTNYFWLVYDIQPTATVGDVVDAQCPSLTVGIPRTPAVTAPAGSRPIVNQIIIGTGTSTGSYPFNTNWGYSRSASLFTAAEVGSPTLLTFLAWNISTATTANIPIKIYLKTTTSTDQISDTWANMIAGATLVYNATTQFTPTGWKNFDITDFSYCADNLLVLCEANFTGTGAGSTVYFYYTSTASNSHQTWTADGSAPTGTGSIGTSRPNIQMTKAPVTVTIPNCATYTSPANGASGITCGLNAVLNWTPSITGCNPPTSYDVYFGTVAAPPFVINQTALSYDPGTLLPSTTYYWKIVPRNSAGPAVGCVTWSYSTGASYAPSQTTPPITDGFENCTDWNIVNGAQPNVWLRGTAIAYTGSYSMYINNTASNNNYNITSASIVHFYKDITFPAGSNDYSLRFYWKGEGESSYDYLRVFLAPTSLTPVAGTQVSTVYELTPYVYNQSASWQQFSINLPIACGGNETWRLIFSWKNDGSGGTQPPIAVDDIMVVTTPRTGNTCANPVNITLPFTRTGETTACMGDDYTNASVSSCGSSYESGEDKVYKILVGAAGCVSFSITNASSTTIGFQLYNGCPDAVGTTCILNTTTGASGGLLSADVNIPSAGFYYLVVDNWAAPSNVDYDISISAPGGNTVNDLPCNAIALTLGVSANGDNTCTNNIGEPAPPACWTNGSVNTVWYKVVLPASRDISIRTTAGALLNTQIALYTVGACGTPGTYTLAGCNDDAPGCGTSYQNSALTVLDAAAAGATVYIVVDGFQNAVGSFSILVIDANGSLTPTWPPIVGQDCGAVTTFTNPICGATTNVSNPGNFAYGNICDFTGAGICLASGERSSIWYTITTSGPGNLEFDIVPNDFGNPNPLTGQVNPLYFSPGDETDYDFALWKWEPTCDGLGDNTFCCTEIAAGTTAATRCNYSGLGVTGLFGAAAGTAPAAYAGFGSAYEARLPVLAGETYVLAISNYMNNYVSGFTLQFSGTSPVAYAVPGATMTWASSTSNAWVQAGNWGGCGPPNCGINAIIAAGGAQPVISSNVSVKDITINVGATLIINANCTLTVCGNFINNGTLTMASTATLLFNNGAIVQNISGSLTGSNKLGNLVISKTGGSLILAAATPLDIGGNFVTQNATSFFNGNNNVIKVAGNFNTAAAGTILNFLNVEFNGTMPQTYTNSSGTITWTNVIMNNSGGGMTLTGVATSNLVIAGVLTLTNGIIYTANPPLLIMNAGSSVPAPYGNTLSFVDGPMQKIGNTNFVFPTGDAFNRWARIGLTNSTLSAGSIFQAQYFYTAYSNIVTMAGAPLPVLNNVSANEYWQCDRIAGTGNASLTLYWENASSSGINSCAALQGGDLVVARWNGAAWENRSNTIVGGITGSCVGSSPGTVTSDVLLNFSPFTFGSKSAIVNPLPIELLSFTGRNAGTENILEWSTSSETNNDFFTLERFNGSTFEALGEVDGAGNSTIVLNYLFEDKNPLVGTNYYRLKQTDFNGLVKYSPQIVTIEFAKPTEYLLYPNPASENIILYTSNSKDENIDIEITDVAGRILYRKEKIIMKNQINNETTISISNFDEGIYYLVIRDASGKLISQKKFIKIKK